MKFLFIVQGEGRGHLTQALALEEVLRRNGHEVIEVLVGKNTSRTLPGFFNRNIKAPVKRFISPNFTPAPDNKGVDLKKSILYSLLHVPEYFRSMRYIHQRIKATGAEVVINFYELLTGLTYAFFRPSVPYVCIGHQYLFLHRDFEFPAKDGVQLFLLKAFTKLTSLRATKRLALSFHEMNEDDKNDIIAVPPLLRQEVTSIQPERGDYIHGYMLNAGFSDSVEAFHKEHPDVPMHFFWDKQDAEEVTPLDDTLRFHRLDDVKFLNFMAGCRAYASTAGFESICEAMYLGKPVLMVPSHIEQECNAYDAAKAGAGIVSDSFKLESLLHFSSSYTPNREFVYWVRSCERHLLLELESVMNYRTAFLVGSFT